MVRENMVMKANRICTKSSKVHSLWLAQCNKWWLHKELHNVCICGLQKLRSFFCNSCCNELFILWPLQIKIIKDKSSPWSMTKWIMCDEFSMEDLKIMIILRVAPQAAHQPRRSSNLKD